MIGYLCATPLHIINAITMQSGMFSEKKSTLIILDHFDVNELVVERIKETNVFDEVILFHSNNKTKWNKVMRLVHSVVPAKTIRQLANDREYTHFVSFALDFINVTYIIKRYKKRGISCEFSYGDDGIGTYMNPNIYRPRKLAMEIMRWTCRLSFLDEIKKLYVYKPEYMVENKHYEIVAIEQSQKTCDKRKRAVCKIWPLDEKINLEHSILYFEQPNVLDNDKKDLETEQEILRNAEKLLNASTIIKMHPRSGAEKQWQAFCILKTKMPFEVILLHIQCKPKLIMTVNSTALFSTYLFEDLQVTNCPSILLYHLMEHQSITVNKSMDKLCMALNVSEHAKHIYNPDSLEELQELLKGLN